MGHCEESPTGPADSDCNSRWHGVFLHAVPPLNFPSKSLQRGIALHQARLDSRENPNDAHMTKVLTEDEARRIASNIAELPELMRGPK